MRWMRMAGIVAVSLALCAVVPGYAADESDSEGFSAYSVTRLKVFEGTAWVRTPDSGDWEEFPTNSPVPSRSVISIPDRSEAELQFHGGQFVLLTAGTELSFRGAEDDATAFRLRAGEIRFYLPEADFAPVRVAMPGGGTTEFTVPGRYWMTVSQSGETSLIVRKGAGTIRREGTEFQVGEGEQAWIGNEVRVGLYTGEEPDSYEEPPPLSEAERQAEVPPAAAYELRDYGEWVFTQDYGYVWRPRVSAGWSPYYYGRWVWVSPYGWTWVSYEPWGWYPYHYGYWYVDPFFGWVWYPFHSFVSVSFVFGHHHFPHFHHRAHFFPARVRFVRDGGRVRWVPLRPGDRGGRIAFTRSDSRLSSWERPLSRGTVFVRGRGSGSGQWRDWSAVRRESREGFRAGGAPLRREEAQRVHRGAGTVPGRREPAAERSRSGRDARPQESIRGTEHPTQVRPTTRPQRWQRVTPPSPPSRGRSDPGMRRANEPDRQEKYGIRVRERGSSPRRPGPSEAGRVSPERIRTERAAQRAREPDRQERYGIRLRERVPSRSRTAPPMVVRESPSRIREGNRTLPPGRAPHDVRVPGSGTGGGVEQRGAAPVERPSVGRSSSPGRSGGYRGNSGRGIGRGLSGFGAGGGRSRGGGSIR